MSWNFILTSLLATGLLPFVVSCPSDCQCKWRGGKQTVECVGKNLKTFPPNIDPGTQIINFEGNSFETLPPDHFMSSGLINLQKVYLPRCRLSHINSRAFRGLSNLVELDLSGNLLREVPPLFDCQGLMRLDLSRNPINALPRRAFSTLLSLTTLELSGTGLELVEGGAFEGLESLEWLKLDGNRLKRLSGLSVLPLALKGVALEDNPWECDCQLLELRLWLVERNVANSVEPTCVRPPRLANQTLKGLSAENFACAPQLSPTTMYQKIGEGKNVSLLCKVSSVPESSLEWHFNGQPLTNSSLNLLVETTAAYHPMGNLHPHSFSQSLAPIEKKSELLILNATAEENGTFLCLAKNLGGSASANFTLRVLSPHDSGSEADDGPFGGELLYGIPQLLSEYPNAFIIVLSTVAVLGLLAVLTSLLFVVCRVRRACRRRRAQSLSPKQEGVNPGGKEDGSCSSVVSICTGKMDLETMTSSKSSFQLTPSAENPDIIKHSELGLGCGYTSSSAKFTQTCGAAEPPHIVDAPWPIFTSSGNGNPQVIDLSKYPKEYYSYVPSSSVSLGLPYTFPDCYCELPHLGIGLSMGPLPQGEIETDNAPSYTTPTGIKKGVGVAPSLGGINESPDEGYEDGTEI